MISLIFVIKTIIVIGFFLFTYPYIIKLNNYMKSFRFYNNELINKIAEVDGLQIIHNKDIRLLKLENENLMNQLNELKNSISLLNEKIDRYNKNTIFDFKNTIFDFKNSNSLLNDKIDRQTKNILIDIKNIINENQSAVNLQMKDINNRIFKVEIQLK